MFDRRLSRRVYVISYLKVKERTTDKNPGRVKYIANEGLGLYGPDRLIPHSDIRLELYLSTPARGRQGISFNAHVVWSRKGEHPGFYDSGVKLIDARDDDVAILEDFIETNAIENRWLAVAEMQYEE